MRQNGREGRREGVKEGLREGGREAGRKGGSNSLSVLDSSSFMFGQCRVKRIMSSGLKRVA